MNVSFISGHRYLRRKLVAFCGSRPTQQGIIWVSKEPGCVLVTSGGKFKKKPGYQDIRQPDGSCDSFGQQSTGNQDPGSKANRLLIQANRSVLLFIAREPTATEVRQQDGSDAKLFQFDALYGVGAWDYLVPSEGPRRGDRLIGFHLFRSLGTSLETPPSQEADYQTAAELRRSIEPTEVTPPRGTLNQVEYARRSNIVRQYFLSVLGATSELRAEPAQFSTAYGDLFLQVDHLYRLGDGGRDLPENVAARCPNCHRAVHHAGNRSDLGRNISKIVKRRQAAMVSAARNSDKSSNHRG